MHVSPERMRWLSDPPLSDQRVKLFKEHARLDASTAQEEDKDAVTRRQAEKDRFELLRRGRQG
jgi:hypothetical protein